MSCSSVTSKMELSHLPINRVIKSYESYKDMNIVQVPGTALAGKPAATLASSN